jgi:hypothetical protein
MSRSAGAITGVPLRLRQHQWAAIMPDYSHAVGPPRTRLPASAPDELGHPPPTFTKCCIRHVTAVLPVAVMLLLQA